MTVVDIFCGLGNQMFQYAYARALQEKRKDKKLYINNNTFKRIEHGRQYSLGYFSLNPNVEILGSGKAVCLDYYSKIKRMILCHTRSKDILRGKERYDKLAKKGLYTSVDVFEYYGIPKTNKKLVFCNGFWQNPRYFENISESIKSELMVKTSPSKENEEMLKAITSCNAVCVHVRRGDYLDDMNRAELAICDEQYYLEGMKYVYENTENPHFFIFSNTAEDLNWIKENYHFSEKYEITYVNLNNPDYEELRLMYSCKHFVISNSTFSWWAQYLSKSKEKLVVAPKVWNNKHKASKGIRMDSWHLI